MGGERGRRKVAEHCDICMEERLSVLEGDTYICEVCLDGEPADTGNPLVKI